MSSIKVYLRDDYKRKDGAQPIYYAYTIKRKVVKFKTGVFVKPKQWDSETNCIKGNSKEVNDNNLLISNCAARINEILVRYRLQQKEITAEQLIKEFETPTAFIDFFDFMKKNIAAKTGINAEGTIKTHNTLLHKLQDFKPVLTFADLTADFLSDFQRHMKVKCKNNPNTIQKMLRILKIYINEAVRQKKIPENPLRIRIRNMAVDRMFLLPEELACLLVAYRENRFDDLNHNVLQVFLFSCFTGLRISDCREIRMDHIQKNVLVFTPAKTANVQKSVKVPLCKPGLQIINNAAPNRLYGRIFAMETDQTINKRLKTIFAEMAINKKISFHCARHTFATIFLRETKNLAALQRLLGHSSVTETMKYVHVLSDDIESEMGIFDKFA